MTEQITSYQVTEWLRAKQPTFTKALLEFGKSIGRGFEWRYREKKYHGQFTGEGLCTFAVAIMEEALKRRYGEAIETTPYFFSTFCMDPETHVFKELAARPHHNLYYRTVRERSWNLADPTYRQFQINIDPNEMMVGVPAEARDRLYSLKSMPVPVRSGHMYRQYLMLMELGDLEGINAEDFQKLLVAYSHEFRSCHSERSEESPAYAGLKQVQRSLSLFEGPPSLLRMTESAKLVILTRFDPYRPS